MPNRPATRFLLTLTLAVSACSGPRTPLPSAPPMPTPTNAVGRWTAPAPGYDDRPETTTTAPIAAAAPVAARFAAAWVHTSAPGWWFSLRPWCEDGLAATLQDTDPGNVPATQVTGPPRPAGGSIDQGLRFEVATDAGTLALTLAAIDGHWLVSDVDFVRTGS